MKIQSQTCSLRYQIMPLDDGDKLSYPSVRKCPHCAAKENKQRGCISSYLAARSLRMLHSQNRLLVADPVSQKVLSGRAIQSIALNGSDVQVSINPAWWTEDDGVLSEWDIHTPSVRNPFEGAEPADVELESELQDVLKWFSSMERLRLCKTVWDPASRRLVLLAPGFASVNGSALQITLPEGWLRK